MGPWVPIPGFLFSWTYTNTTGCQVNKLNHLQPVGEVLGICDVDKNPNTLNNLEVDELLLAQGQKAAGSDAPIIYQGNCG